MVRVWALRKKSFVCLCVFCSLFAPLLDGLHDGSCGQDVSLKNGLLQFVLQLNGQLGKETSHDRGKTLGHAIANGVVLKQFDKDLSEHGGVSVSLLTGDGRFSMTPEVDHAPEDAVRKPVELDESLLTANVAAIHVTLDHELRVVVVEGHELLTHHLVVDQVHVLGQEGPAESLEVIVGEERHHGLGLVSTI